MMNRDNGRTAWSVLGLLMVLWTGNAQAYDVTIVSGASANGSWSGNAWTPSSAGSVVSASEVTNKLASGPVTITATGSDKLTVSTGFAWSANTLTLSAGGDIALLTSLDGSGTAGLALEYGQNAVASGNTSTYLVSGPVHLASTGSYSTKLGSDGTPANYTILTSLGAAGSITGTDLQGMEGNWTGNYALGADIDASATAGWNGGLGFQPVASAGYSVAGFTGKFDGLGHVIDRLTINRPAGNYIGLFGHAESGSIANLGLTRASITGGLDVGGLVGTGMLLNLSNSYVTGAVSGTQTVGGLMGRSRLRSTLSNVYSTASVTATVDCAGGLIGYTSLRVSISNSYATGAVSGGSVVGGLAGQFGGATVSNSYFAGTVSGTAYVGALAGVAYQGTAGGGYTNVYWNSDTAGSTAFGLVDSNPGAQTNVAGLTTAQMRDAANWAGFTFTTTPGGSGWVLVGNDGTLNGASGTVLPMLASEWSPVIHNAHQLQLLAMSLGTSYALANNIDAAATNGGANDVWLSSSFMPVGTAGTPFTGDFDGLNHVIEGLIINYPANDYVGLFGFLTGSTSLVHDVGLVGGDVTGRDNVGALAGWSDDGNISNAFVTVTIHGRNQVGGLIGFNDNDASVADSYATGAVTGADSVGGLAGRNDTTASIRRCYAAGVVSGSTNFGGLVGYNNAAVADSYWDKVATGQNASAGGTGIASTALMQTQSSFTGFDLTVTPVWRIYEGHTYPLLESFLTPLTVTANADSKTYDGIAYSGGNGVTYSIAAPTLSGTLAYSGTSQGAINVGGYVITPGGYWSDQQGYDISYADGALSVNTTPLSITANNATKAYNGSPWSGGNGVSYSGFVNGEGAGVLGGTLVYGGTSQGAINTGNYIITPGGLTSSNYAIAFHDGTLSILPVSYTGTTATEGSATATVSGGGTGCGFTTSQFVPAVNPPAGVTFPHGLFNFTLSGCTPGGAATLDITYPSTIPAGTQYWKYGPTPDNHTSHWYTIPASISGNTITFTLTDGETGDDDYTANGVIVDAGGPGIFNPTAIPTLSEWGVILLAGMLGVFGIGMMRRSMAR